MRDAWPSAQTIRILFFSFSLFKLLAKSFAKYTSYFFEIMNKKQEKGPERFFGRIPFFGQLSSFDPNGRRPV